MQQQKHKKEKVALD
jgi:hypothetical protein